MRRTLNESRFLLLLHLAMDFEALKQRVIDLWEIMMRSNTCGPIVAEILEIERN